MSAGGFVHLRNHTACSLAEGAIRVKELVRLARAEGMPAVAITDTNNLFGALEFASVAAGEGVQPILGCQLDFSEEGRDPAPIVLLAQSETGWLNLLGIVAKAYLGEGEALRPLVRFDTLNTHAEGLICLTGGAQGPIGRWLAAGQVGAAESLLQRFASLFAGRLYVELQRHGLAREEAVEPGLIDLAYRLDLPLVATNECFFARRESHEAHDALLCIADGRYVSEEDRRRETPEHEFKSAEAMRSLFADLPEAVDNTLVIARRCAFLLKKIDPILPPYDTKGGRSEADELAAQAAEGLAERLAVHVFGPEMDEAARAARARPYHERLERELGIITQMGFPGYFLIVADFIQWAKNAGIPVGPGRGSGAGSVVAWALKITDLDPLRFGLLFERFLNPERVSMPDFDIDFCQERRDEVIDYVRRKYGADRVAQIITFGKLQARAAVRDVGRVLQMPYGQVDRLSKLIEFNPAKPVTLQQAIDKEPILQAERANDETVDRLFTVALQLEGLFRNASTHAAGVVIGDRPLAELIPLYRDFREEDGMAVTQYDMKWVEQAGLVKFDFLGLKTLTVLKTAIDLITDRQIDLDTLPLDDEASYDLMCRGETVGVFQLESAGMRDALKGVQPRRFEDIIALVSLYRPGPMDNIPKYVEVKEGRAEPDYLHPLLQPVLEETYGIFVYQEQVMQAAQILAGYSLGGADLLRRAMGKKIASAMAAERDKFVAGAIANGVEEGQASGIFDTIAKFAEYGFNKSHAAAYALIAYHTAYLKAHYPAEFIAASMTLDLGNTDKLAVFKKELVRLGIPLLPPDVNASGPVFGVERTRDGPAIRYALGAIKGVGRAAMEALVAEREANGCYKTVFDLMSRLDPVHMNKRQLDRLIAAGALDGFGFARASLLASTESLIAHGHAAAADRDSNQSSLFGDSDDALPPPRLAEREEFEPLERLKLEQEAVGFYLSAHPLDGTEKLLERLRGVTSRDLESAAQRGQTRVRLLGIVESVRIRSNSQGSRYAFVALSDSAGGYEVMLFSETLAVSRALLEVGARVVVTADLQLRDDRLRVTASRIESVDEVQARSAAGLRVWLADSQAATHLHKTLGRAGAGRGQVTIIVPLDRRREVEIAMPGGFAIRAETRAALKSIPGILDVAML